MTCARCGSVNPPESKFCNSCGSSLAPVAQASAAGIPPPQSGQPTPGRLPPLAITAEGAKLALILGLVAWVFCGFPTGIPAVIVGRRAMKRIEQSRGSLKGRELALAGVILGYASCAVWLLVLIAGYAVYRPVAKEGEESEASAINAIRQINDAEASYSQIYTHGAGHAYTSSLATLGPGPTGTCAGTGSREYACLMDGPLVAPGCREPYWCDLKGYKFLLRPYYSSSRDVEYVVTATPLESSAGTKNFCSTSDGIVRSADKLFWSLHSGYEPEECHGLKPVDGSQ